MVEQTSKIKQNYKLNFQKLIQLVQIYYIQMNFSSLCNQFDKQKASELVIGIIGVNVAFLIAGIQYEKITTMTYLNTTTGEDQYFRTTAGFIMIERFINWFLGLIYQHFTLPKNQRVIIPTKNSLSTGFIIYLSSIAQTESMYLVSYPLIIMAKSCSLLNVILVGIFCSRVINKQLKLGHKKIIVAIAVTVGIVMFRLFDPKTTLDDGQKTEMIGLFLLLISLFADGFIPDFQAQIKQKYKPAPIQMLIKMNKWTGICALIHLGVTNKLVQFFTFCVQHPEYSWDLLLLSLSAFVGQIFIYRMIKQFKQHIVPFVVTTRKIITVGLSLIYFHHETNFGQISAIIVVFVATVYEFLDSIKKQPQPAKPGQKQIENIVVSEVTGLNQMVSQRQLKKQQFSQQTNYQDEEGKLDFQDKFKS